MPTPTSWSSWKYPYFADDANTNALVQGRQWESHTISFSFPTSTSHWSTDPSTGYGPSNGDGEPWNGFAALDASDKTAIRTALASWSAVADLRFVEVVETRSSVGDLRFGYSRAVDSGAQAHAYAPWSGANGGDVWFNVDSSSYNQVWTPGTYEYQTAIHEIGHTLGLKHSFESSPFNRDVVGSGCGYALLHGDELFRAGRRLEHALLIRTDDTHVAGHPGNPATCTARAPSGTEATTPTHSREMQLITRRSGMRVAPTRSHTTRSPAASSICVRDMAASWARAS